MTRPLLGKLEALVAEEHARKRQRVTVRRAELERRVAAYLVKHPKASSNAVFAAVGGRRNDVLAAIRAVKQAGGWYPSDGYQ